MDFFRASSDKSPCLWRLYRQSVRKESSMCPFSLGQMSSAGGDIICFGIKVFLLIWIVFVPIAITARLEKIIKLLEDDGK